MGKPHSREEAIDMIRHLSGCEHKVITAITLRDSACCRTLSDTALVHFRNLTDREIEYYVDKYRPFDKAGAYGIQEWIGYVGIDRIEGSYFTIMGLPVHLVYQELVKLIG
jgi:septum formation protein